MDLKEFVSKFKPQTEKKDDKTELKKFDWADLEDMEILKNTSKENTWTCVQDEDKKYLTPGRRFINRLYYVVCEESNKDFEGIITL